jgi:hypothetical protein
MRSLPNYVTATMSALSFREAHPEFLQTLNDSEWRDLLVFGDHMRLTLPLAQVANEFLPEWVRSEVDQKIADNTRRFPMIKHCYAEIAEALKNADADCVVLKGFTKSPDYVPDPRQRVQGDIDLYCPPGMIVRAGEALGEIGYEPIYRFEAMPWDHLPPLRRKTSWQWRGNVYDPEMPLGIELHHCFWDYSWARCGPENLDEFWHRRIPRQLEDISFSALAPVDNVGYLALNLLRDLMRIPLITSQVYELAWFLHHHAHDDAFWKQWTEWHDEELRRFESIPFLLASIWFRCDLPQAVVEEIERLPLSTRRWFVHPATAPSPMGWLQPSKDGLWLHSSLLPTRAAKRDLVFRRLFPRRPRPVNVVVADASPNQPSSNASLWQTSRQYARYLSKRVSYHLRFLPPTLWHGFRWWRSARN